MHRQIDSETSVLTEREENREREIVTVEIEREREGCTDIVIEWVTRVKVAVVARINWNYLVVL